MEKRLVRRGSSMRDHTQWVTAIAPINNSHMIVTSSRDKSIMLWDLTRNSCAYCMEGHKNSVEDLVTSSDGVFALSSSLDRELRLWDLETGKTVRHFLGHRGGVYSGAISVGNGHIVSASADKSIKLWDTRGRCAHTFSEAHSDLVSCVRFGPNSSQPTIVSCSWDGKVKLWDLRNCEAVFNGHDVGFLVNTLALSSNGVLCVSGGEDGKIVFWDVLNEENICTLNVQSSVLSLCFEPNTYRVCVATTNGIMICDKTHVLVNHKEEGFTSLNWSEDTLYSGYDNGVVRGWGVE